MEERGKPLSKFQYSVWKGQKLHPDSPLYNMVFTFDIYGKIDPGIFREAFEILVGRTTMLKICLNDSNENVPQQVVKATNAELEYIDTDSIEEFHLQDWIKEKNTIKFDLQTRSYYSALIRITDDHFIWYINQHHIFTDAYSFQVMYTNLDQIYRAKLANQTKDIELIDDYDSFALLNEKDKEEPTKEFRTLSTNSKHLSSLYSKTFPSHKTTRSDRTSTTLSPELVNKIYEKLVDMTLRTLSANLDLISFLISSLLVLLSQVAENSEGLAISNIFSKRMSKISKGIAQPLLEVLSHHINFSNEESFTSIYEKVHSFFMLRENKDSTLAPSLAPLIINFFNLNFGSFNGYETDCKWHHCDHMDDHHHIRLHVIKYNSADEFTLAFDVKTIEGHDSIGQRLTEDYLRLLNKLCSFDFAAPINQLCLISDDSLSELETKVNTISQFQMNQNDYILNVIKNQMMNHGDRVALHAKEKTISYAELASKVAILSANLGQLDIVENSKVVIYLPRGEEYIYAILASLFCKASFIPVPTTYPLERLRYIITDVDADLVISVEVIDGVELKSVQIDECLNRTSQATEIVLDGVGESCYTLYTSGSTGEPKGVPISHASFSNYIKSAAEKYLNAEAYHMPFFTSVGFDLTMTSIFLPLYTGGSIHIYEEQNGLNVQIQEVIENPSINCLKCTPSHLKLVDDQEVSQSIKALIVGGEKLETSLAKSFAEKTKDTVSIYNEYGPTEATVGCIVYRYNAHDYKRQADLPIGLPLDNYFAFIANKAGTPLPYGVIGELCVGGVGLSKGYLNNSTITEQKFISHNSFIKSPFYKTGDYALINERGDFEFYGRKDDQLKIGGIRIETGEIEHYLNLSEHIKSCVVTGKQDRSFVDTSYTYCSNCGLPSNYPTADMDDNNVCTYCRSFEGYKNKVAKYFKSEEEFADLFVKAQTQESSHDCIMLYSGGKDSTYALGKLAQMGLKVLAFTLDNGYISEKAKENINRIVKALGVDHVYGSTPAMNEIFVESLKTHCNVCNGCFKTIYNLSLKIAFEQKIPFIVTGLSRGQFFETKLSEEIFWKPMNDAQEIEETLFAARQAYHDVRDTAYTKAGGRFIQEHDVLDHVRILDFYRYHDVSLQNLYKFISTELPWIRPDDTGRSTNCLINKVGIYIHKNKKGYSNYAFPYSWDVRTGHKTKEETIDEIEEYIDEAEVKEIINEIGYTEERSTKQLVTYYTGEIVDSTVLKQHLLTYLPHYMIPARYIHVEHMPLTSNGKVDINALNKIEGNIEKEILDPENEIEQLVHDIWKEVLERNILSTDDDFFNLGGTSLDAIRIIARIEKAINYELKVKYIFQLPNIRDLSQHIMQDMLSILENSST